MPRRGLAAKRKVTADPIYNNTSVTKFINRLMTRGKKSLAERIFYNTLEHIRGKTGREPMEVFERAIKNVTPTLEVRPRRIGGATYQVPMEVRPDRQIALAIRWIVGSARRRAGKSMQEKLAAELLDASQGTGPAVKKRDDTHKMAEANKAFAHYRW